MTGYVVEARNAGRLAAKIEELASERQKRIDMGMNGYRKFQEQFAIDMFEKRMRDVLKQIAQNPSHLSHFVHKAL